MKVARQDLQHAAGSSQLCAGQIGGCVHAMKQFFASHSVDGVMLQMHQTESSDDSS